MMWQEIIVYLTLAITIGVIVCSVCKLLTGKRQGCCSCSGNRNGCNRCCNCKQDLSEKHTVCTSKKS